MSYDSRARLTLVLVVLATAVLALQPLEAMAQSPLNLHVTIDPQSIRFSTPAGEVLDWRLLRRRELWTERGIFQRPAGCAGGCPESFAALMTGNVQRMIVTNSGDVGIGIAAPAVGRLQVVGADLIGGQIQVGANTTTISRRIVSFGDIGCGQECVYIGEEDEDDHLVLSGASGVWVKGPNLSPDVDNSADFGDSTHRWSVVFAANGTIQTSDARMKKEINGLRYGLREVVQLRPVMFEWKNNTSDTRRHLGFLAQDVEPVMPEVVHRDANPDAPLGMNYTDLVPVVIRAIQEQQTIIDRKSAELEAVKTDNSALRERVAALELVVQQLMKKVQ